MNLRRSSATAAAAVLLLGLATAVVAPEASAQEPPPGNPPVANCGFLSAVVCQVPVNVGPIGPFEFLFPNGIFGSPPGAPGNPTVAPAAIADAFALPTLPGAA